MTKPTTELTHLFRQLKAPAAARALPTLADRTRAEDWSYEQFAAVLLKTQTDSRDSHGGHARIKSRSVPSSRPRRSGLRCSPTHGAKAGSTSNSIGYNASRC